VRTVVAHAKLQIPRPRQPLLPRSHLATRLDGDHRMTLVSAPAGYGKTAMLSAWATACDEPVAWLSCDPSDEEPIRFMSCLLAAISARWPGVADDAWVVLERNPTDVHDAVVAVANDLSNVADPGVILVDDLHWAAPSRALLTALVDALPDHVRFVAGTRRDPPLSLARLRLHGELLELRADDLRFTPAESEGFFALHDLGLSEGDLGRLHDLTEGWPAGEQLAALALRRGSGIDAFIDALASTDRAVGDFLVSEVLAGLPPEVQTFLVETSVLDEFDAALCQDVTGIAEADAMVEGLLADGLFVVPIDDRARRYRYHHLFRTFLRARLASVGPAGVHDAHDRACRALEARGDTAGALRHCMAMDDIERGGQIIRAALERTMSLADCAEAAELAVREWLLVRGQEAIATDPLRVVELVHQLTILTGADDAPSWLERVRRAHPDAGGELAAAIAEAWGEHHLHQGQPQEALRHLGPAADVVDGDLPASGLVSLLQASIARAHIHAGDLDAAGAVIDEALERPVGSPATDSVHHPGIAGFVAAAGGELKRAEAMAGRALRSAERLGVGDHGLGQVYARLAQLECHLERGEHELAAAALDDVKGASERSRRLTLRCLARLAAARTARALGDEGEARDWLVQARLTYAEPDASVRQVFDEEAVAQALQFDPPMAARAIAMLDPDRATTQVLRSRLALLERDDRTAADILDGMPAPTTRRERVEHGVQRALSVLERDVEEANRRLHDALTLAQPEGLIRVVVDQGPLVHKLLLSYTPADAQAGYVEDLLAVTSHMVAPVRVRATQALVAPLSDREVTVLRYLCSRLTYREIAGALYVSVNTLKSHVRSVYRKLGVESRRGAVDAGRRAGLI